MKPLNPQTAYEWAIKLAARREYCQQEMFLKLVKCGLSKRETENMLLRLVAEGFIDEQRYANAYAHDKLCLSKWGRLKVMRLLSAKGIKQEHIDKALTQVSEEEYRQLLHSVLQKRAMEISEDDPQKRWIALIRFAQGRGFELDLIRSCLGKE